MKHNENGHNPYNHYNPHNIDLTNKGETRGAIAGYFEDAAGKGPLGEDCIFPWMRGLEIHPDGNRFRSTENRPFWHWMVNRAVTYGNPPDVRMMLGNMAPWFGRLYCDRCGSTVDQFEPLHEDREAKACPDDACHFKANPDCKGHYRSIEWWEEKVAGYGTLEDFLMVYPTEGSSEVIGIEANTPEPANDPMDAILALLMGSAPLVE